MKKLLIGFVGLFGLSISPSILAQQTTGDILGTVTDSSGAAVQGASVTVTNTGTQIPRTATSAANGDFVVNLLQTGTYGVTISAPGFKSFNESSIALAAGARIRVDVRLAPGEVSQSITVEAQASALQTDNSALSTTIPQVTVQNAPLNGRNFVQLVQVQVGVNQGPPNGLDGGTRPADLRQTATFSANGQDDVLNDEMIDGADNNERLTGTVAVRSSLDAIDQVQVQTSDYTADVGRTGGAVVDVVTKAGTDKFHGDVFEFLRNDITDADSYSFGANTKKSELRWNQFGGSLGGPIVRNRAFFFGDYEGYRLREGLSPVINTVPTLYEEQHPGDFTDHCPTVGTACPGGPLLTAARIDAAGLDYFKLNPAPNEGTNQYYGIPTESQSSNDFDLRGDYHFDPNDSVFARFAFNKVSTAEPGSLPVASVASLNINPYSGTIGTSNELDYNSAINYTRILSPSLVMNLFASYTRADNSTYPHDQGLNPNQAFGQQNVNTTIGDSSALAPITVQGGTSLGDVNFVPVTHADNTFQYVGSLTYVHGSHNVKAGGSLIRRQLFSLQSNAAEGSWAFQNGNSTSTPYLNGYPNLLQGLYYTVTRNLDLFPPHFRVWETGAYVVDNWRIRTNLALNLGLRYDHYTPYAEIHNHAASFNPGTGALLVAGQNGVSNTAGVQTDFQGLEPRVGAALNLAHGLVIRGGYAISFFPMNTTSIADLKNPPFVSTLSACGDAPNSPTPCPAGTPTFANGLPVPAAVSLSTPGVTIPDAIDPDFRTSYIHQYNLTAQKQLFGNILTASYVGLLGRDLIQYLSLNAAAPSTAPLQARRPYYSVDPNLGDVSISRSHGTSNYSALQASLDRQFSKGFGYNVNYTYAQSLGNYTPGSEQGQGGYGFVPSQVNTVDYGNSPLEVRHVIAGTITYALPVGQHATGLEAVFIKDWNINALSAWSTGLPFTVLNPINVSNTETAADRLDVVGNPVLSNPVPGPLGAFFNPGAFASQTRGTLGSERIMQYFGPHYRHLDIGLSKTFELMEGIKLDFTAQAFNIFNTPNFANPNASLPAVSAVADTPSITLSNIASAANTNHFGQITSMITSYNPRVFQFSLKVHF